MSGPARVVAALSFAGLFAGCGARRLPDAVDPAGLRSALYGARLEHPEHGRRRFRLLLFAAEPDRIHAEVLSPLGTVELILDMGQGRAALVVPDERVCYAGPDDGAALGHVLGLPLSGSDLTQALLRGTSPPGVAVTRQGAAGGRYPSRVTLELGSTRLALELKHLTPLGRPAAALGTGSPPAGMAVEPFESLDRGWLGPP